MTHTVHVYGVPVTLTDETIATTWAAFAAECREQARAALAGEFFANNPRRYAEEQEAQARRYDARDCRMSVSFIQHAVYLQTGEHVPLLSDRKAAALSRPEAPSKPEGGE